ncbi:MAG: Gfo/Idh/MocA family oxidoreductase [Planctomycetes bacterium]|nr:Gfo/Idh/MocA family oxidoreductase [Planctomycetota bacterium]
MATIWTRRTFMKHAAVTGAAATFPLPSVLSNKARADALRVAFIGVGGIGNAHTGAMAKLDVVCPCFTDADTRQMGNAKKRFEGAATYRDYRQMFDREHDKFDAVMVGTPDHHHYPATAIAISLGKHVYTQKPLTQYVWEARALNELSAKKGVVTQMGNQGHAGEGWRKVVAYVKSGWLGDIREVHTWTNRPVWPQGIGRPDGEDAVPDELDWDAWIGPAPMRPYKNGTYHTFNWRGWWDFGAGALGDMACHTMDGLFWALEPGAPTRITPFATPAGNDETFPNQSVIRWDFPAKGTRPGFQAYWYDGGLFPSKPLAMEKERKLPKTGNLFVGTKATLLVSGDYGGNPRIIPESLDKELGEPPRVIERSIGHYEEWVEACKGNGRTLSNFAYAGPMTEAILLGNVALRLGRELVWDAPNMRIAHDEEATMWLRRKPREGWAF